MVLVEDEEEYEEEDSENREGFSEDANGKKIHL